MIKAIKQNIHCPSFKTHELIYIDQWGKQCQNKSKTISNINHDLLELCGVNEYQPIDNILNTYIPLVHLLNKHITYHKQLYKYSHNNTEDKPPPYLIGITGSVAVGKSTTSRILKKLLSIYYPEKKVGIINTDGFLFTNKELEKKQLMTKKGFPQSYNQELMLETLINIKNKQKTISLPLYSHEYYDIVPNSKQIIHKSAICGVFCSCTNRRTTTRNVVRRGAPIC